MDPDPNLIYLEPQHVQYRTGIAEPVILAEIEMLLLILTVYSPY